MSRLIFAFCYIAQDEGGIDFIYKLTFKTQQFEKKVPDAQGRLLRLRGSPLLQLQLRGEQQVKGGCQIGARPQCKAWPWPKAES